MLNSYVIGNNYVCYIMYVRIDWGKYVRTGGHMYPSLLEACRAESEASVNIYHVSAYTPDHPSPLEMWLIFEFHLNFIYLLNLSIHGSLPASTNTDSNPGHYMLCALLYHHTCLYKR